MVAGISNGNEVRENCQIMSINHPSGFIERGKAFDKAKLDRNITKLHTHTIIQGRTLIGFLLLAHDFIVPVLYTFPQSNHSLICVEGGYIA